MTPLNEIQSKKRQLKFFQEANNRIKEKLMQQGKLNDDEKMEIDSLVESAYNS